MCRFGRPPGNASSAAANADRFAANCVCFIIIGHHYHDRAAFAQGIFIDEHLVFRQSFEDVAFDGSASRAASYCAERAEQHSPDNSDCEHLTNSRNQKAREHRH